MERLLDFKVSWIDLWQTVVILTIAFFLLHAIARLLKKVNVFGHYQDFFEKSIRNTLLIFEPLAILIIISYFVLINPLINGGFVAALLVVGGNLVKNYLVGKMLQWNNSFAVGDRIGINKSKGIISRKNRTGLFLKTRKGAHFFTFNQLYNNGFTIFSGEEAGGFYQLKLTPESFDEKIDYKTQLADDLADSPYLNWNYKTEIWHSKESTQQFNVKVFVKEEQHLNELLQVIQDWGFNSKIIKN